MTSAVLKALPNRHLQRCDFELDTSHIMVQDDGTATFNEDTWADLRAGLTEARVNYHVDTIGAEILEYTQNGKMLIRLQALTLQ